MPKRTWWAIFKKQLFSNGATTFMHVNVLPTLLIRIFASSTAHRVLRKRVAPSFEMDSRIQ
jgi:hypothetical protein